MKHIFTQPERCVAGTVGEPGERAFFIQVREGSRLLSVAIEKAQVQAIVARIEVMVSEVRKSDPLIKIEKIASDDAPLQTPVEPEFQVRAISLSWNSVVQCIYLELYELEDDEGETEGVVLEISMSLGMAASFVTRSKAVVNAGRIPCQLCGIPIDPRGHLCPRANGYKR